MRWRLGSGGWLGETRAVPAAGGARRVGHDRFLRSLPPDCRLATHPEDGDDNPCRAWPTRASWR